MPCLRTASRPKALAVLCVVESHWSLLWPEMTRCLRIVVAPSSYGGLLRGWAEILLVRSSNLPQGVGVPGPVVFPTTWTPVMMAVLHSNCVLSNYTPSW